MKTAQAVSGSSTAVVPPGWTGRAPKMEVINGITVPPEPAPSINNATLAGVDVNNNGVRDDIERLVAQKWPKNFADGISVAKATQIAILQNASIIDEPLQKSSFCALALNKIDSNAIMPSILNTEDRYRAYMQNIGLSKIYQCD